MFLGLQTFTWLSISMRLQTWLMIVFHFWGWTSPCNQLLPKTPGWLMEEVFRSFTHSLRTQSDISCVQPSGRWRKWVIWHLRLTWTIGNKCHVTIVRAVQNPWCPRRTVSWENETCEKTHNILNKWRATWASYLHSEQVGERWLRDWLSSSSGGMEPEINHLVFVLFSQDGSSRSSHESKVGTHKRAD